MTTWMIHGSRAKPAAKTSDFMKFIQKEFDCEIKERTAHVWLHSLGFRYKVGTAQEIYNDGHQRLDVQTALRKYIEYMQDLQENCVTLTGDDMTEEVKGARLHDDPSQKRVVIS